MKKSWFITALLVTLSLAFVPACKKAKKAPADEPAAGDSTGAAKPADTPASEPAAGGTATEPAAGAAGAAAGGSEPAAGAAGAAAGGSEPAAGGATEVKKDEAAAGDKKDEKDKKGW